MIVLPPAQPQCHVLRDTSAKPLLGVSHAFLQVLRDPSLQGARKAVQPKCYVLRDAFAGVREWGEGCLNPLDCGPAGCRGFCQPPPRAA
jgi:hypothetical protein